jgi:hypothetical protein
MGLNHVTVLLMKRQFYDAIRSGEKTTTLRYWKRLMVKPGSVHTIPHLGKVHIDAVDIVEIDDLTEDDDSPTCPMTLATHRPASNRDRPWLRRRRGDARGGQSS